MTSKTPSPPSSKKDGREVVDIGADLDMFTAALEGTRASLGDALRRPGEVSRYASRAALEASWRDSVADLQACFEKTDELGRTLIDSIRAVLARR